MTLAAAKIQPIKRTVLCYHGGKFRLAPWIISHFPTHRIYVEPFGGAASVLLQKPRCYSEVYNDLDDDVVNVFRVMRNDVSARRLRDLLRNTPFSRTEFKSAYTPTADPVERARRLIVRSFQGFGSAAAYDKHRTGFRANSNRSGTVPAHDWQHYPDHVESFLERLSGVVIECRPAVEVIDQHDGPDTLIYADPPYVHSTRMSSAKIRHVYRYEMINDQHRALAAVLQNVKGMVVLSGYADPLYDELYGGWKRVEHKAMADGARPRTECLWLSPATVARSKQMCLPEEDQR